MTKNILSWYNSQYIYNKICLITNHKINFLFYTTSWCALINKLTSSMAHNKLQTRTKGLKLLPSLNNKSIYWKGKSSCGALDMHI